MFPITSGPIFFFIFFFYHLSGQAAKDEESTRSPTLLLSHSHGPLPNLHSEAGLPFHGTGQPKANLHGKRTPLSLIPQIKLTRALEAIRLASRIQNGKEYCAVGSKVAFQISSQNWYLEYHVKELQHILNSNQ